MIDIKKTLHEGVVADVSRWPTFDGKSLLRHKYVTSSEIKSCARRIKFEKLWAEASYTDGTGYLTRWGFAERGNAVEVWAVDKLTKAGVELEYAGKDQVSFHLMNQAGTPDGMHRYKSGLWVHEFKSFDPRKRRDNIKSPNHVSQLQQNMDLVHYCLDTPVYGGTLTYINASDFQDVLQFDVEPDHAHQQELQDRAEWIMAAETPADLPNEGMFNGDCDYCGFTEECSRIVAGDFADLQNAGKGIFK
jgi:hypothetical protein